MKRFNLMNGESGYSRIPSPLLYILNTYIELKSYQYYHRIEINPDHYNNSVPIEPYSELYLDRFIDIVIKTNRTGGS
jgi:hypothetical protein